MEQTSKQRRSPSISVRIALGVAVVLALIVGLTQVFDGDESSPSPRNPNVGFCVAALLGTDLTEPARDQAVADALKFAYAGADRWAPTEIAGDVRAFKNALGRLARGENPSKVQADIRSNVAAIERYAKQHCDGKGNPLPS